MKTIFHSYKFDIGTDEGRAEYGALRAKLEGMGLKCFETWGGASHYMPDLDGFEIELETAHLFDNQWNTAPIPGISDKGRRVFDWAQDYMPEGMAQWLKRGHWLEQTAEMREARRNTVKCGYCGRQEPAAKGYVFCPHCIDSEYLTEKDLHLTRMVPVDSERAGRAPLTEAERAHLLPLYREAQLHGTTERGKARIAKARRDVEEDYAKGIANATSKRDGARWVLDHFPNLIGNWLFYSHSGRHCFGWRTPLDAAALSALLDAISEFPFPYEIKCADGRTLTGER